MAKFRFVAFLVLVIASSHAFAWNEQFGNCLFMVAQLPIMKDPRIQEFLQRATRNAVGTRKGSQRLPGCFALWKARAALMPYCRYPCCMKEAFASKQIKSRRRPFRERLPRPGLQMRSRT